MRQKILQIAVLIVLAAAAGYYLTHHKVPQTQSDQQNNTTNDQSQTFTSDKLGISFQYSVSDAQPGVVEDGNKVYVGGEPDGQWVEEFTKDPKDDLATAIKKQLLVNISDKACFVSVDHSGSTDTAEISIVGLKGGLDDPLFANNPCPPDYRETNGIRYFYMDENHADKFFFFSIGQYAIPSEPGGQTTWQDTFQVTK
jgi:hypothetical protein